MLLCPKFTHVSGSGDSRSDTFIVEQLPVLELTHNQFLQPDTYPQKKLLTQLYCNIFLSAFLHSPSLL